MRLLLDTQIFIWHAVAPERIKLETYSIIREPAHSVFVSEISLLEIAIKQKTGKLPTVTFPIKALEELALASGLSMLPIKSAHIAAYDRIPLMVDHRDPFDRLLLATALAEGLQIISADKSLPQYAPLVSVIAG